MGVPVHPHGCGERLLHLTHSGGRGGSSPRVWGTPRRRYLRYRLRRFIPTGVGNALTLTRKLSGVAVHPHGCGERLVDCDNDEDHDGSSPRVWGTLMKAICRLTDYRFIPTGVGNA